MANRSTRNKIKHQADKMMDGIEMTLIHLRTIDTMANGGSAWITENMPILVNMTVEYKKLVSRFSKGL